MFKHAKIIWILLILGVGIYARFYGLAEHFSKVDDLGVAKHLLDYKVNVRGGKSMLAAAMVAIPRRWTYAPFQFWITTFLVKPYMPYPELLFWGRLPSAVFSSLGLILTAFFYQAYDRWKSGRGFLALTLMAVSWESIIHAKQMHNYALGVTALVMLLILFLAAVRKKEFPPDEERSPSAPECGPALGRPFFMAAAGFGTGVLCWMHYQILFFAPAFFAALLFIGFKDVPRARLMRSFAAACVAFLVVVVPLWWLYLKGYGDAGVNWNRGANGEYFFSSVPGVSWLQSALRAVPFFVRNYLIVFESNTGFLYPGGPWQILFYYGLGSCFIVGIFTFYKAGETAKRHLGIFLFFGLLIWTALVFGQKITLSPTRHSLILLPLMAIVTSEGLEAIASGAAFGARFPGRVAKAVQGTVSAVILTAFLAGYPKFIETRRNFFDENKIAGLLREYQVDTLMRYETIDPMVMWQVLEYFHDYSLFWSIYGILESENSRRNTIAWVSATSPLTRATFKEMVNDGIAAQNTLLAGTVWPPERILEDDLAGYDIVYSEAYPGTIETDYNSRLGYSPHCYYFYILKRK